MKRIFLIRHAKAESLYGGIDFDRKLNLKGIQDAKLVSNYLSKKYDTPNYLITSTAQRTIETTQYFTKAWNIPPKNIHTSFNLYEEINVQDFLTLLDKVDNTYNSLVIVGHNPWISYLGQQFSKAWNNILSTCSCLILDCPTDHWNELEVHSCDVVEYLQTKELLQ